MEALPLVERRDRKGIDVRNWRNKRTGTVHAGVYGSPVYPQPLCAPGGHWDKLYEPTDDPVTCRNCLKRRDKEKKKAGG